MLEIVDASKLPVKYVKDTGTSYHSVNGCYVLQRTLEDYLGTMPEDEAVSAGLSRCPYCHG